MKKAGSFWMALVLLLTLSGCSETQTASKGAVSNSGTVSQIMEDAAKGADAVELVPALPAEMEPVAQQPLPELPVTEGVDVDLTRMSSTMVYAEVSNMMYCPDDYVGKIVRMQGQNINSYYDVTEQTYHSVLIADATACCAQGLEYVLADDSAEYPDDDLDITVTGEFELYEELGMMYCRLKSAQLS